MKQSSLLGQFVSYEENGVLWIRSQDPRTDDNRLSVFDDDDDDDHGDDSYIQSYKTFSPLKPDTSNLVSGLQPKPVEPP